MSGVEYNDDDLEAGEGSAGEPSERAEEELAALADQPPPSPEELLRRQALLGEVRRRGGPDLRAETAAREEAQEDVPDIAPTETQDEESPNAQPDIHPSAGGPIRRLVGAAVAAVLALFRRGRVR